MRDFRLITVNKKEAKRVEELSRNKIYFMQRNSSSLSCFNDRVFNTHALCVRGLEFKSTDGPNGQTVLNSSSPLQHLRVYASGRVALVL